MQLQIFVFALLFLAAQPIMARADDSPFFAGIDILGGGAVGSSHTTNGGGTASGGGVVNNVKFGASAGIGLHGGYQITPEASAFLSYQFFKGDIRWNADFPVIGFTSIYKGSAISNMFMGNLAYEFPLSESLALKTTVGAGASLNALTGLQESDQQSGLFLSKVKGKTTLNPVAQVGAGIRYKPSPATALHLNASMAYSGGFETGKTRKGNMGITQINPYEIENVWRGNLGVSFTIAF